MPCTCGSTAKFHDGGGEAVPHSSVRPSQGSPVRSRRCSRVRMLHASCTTIRLMPMKISTAPQNAAIMYGCHDGSA